MLNRAGPNREPLRSRTGINGSGTGPNRAERSRALSAVLKAERALSEVLQERPGPVPPAAAAGPCTPAMEARAAGSGGAGYNESLLHKVGMGAAAVLGERGNRGEGCKVHGGGVPGRREGNCRGRVPA